jgi:hypothetical protein
MLRADEAAALIDAAVHGGGVGVDALTGLAIVGDGLSTIDRRLGVGVGVGVGGGVGG